MIDSPRHKAGGSGVVIGTKARAMQQQQKAMFNGPTYSSDSNAYSSGKETDTELPVSEPEHQLGKVPSRKFVFNFFPFGQNL